ncbi:hypothetical protein H0H87_010328 [Tephrocybe sp. NHM501043]|nr:hypothetical protein H0H87_010328 [Tephrocybe sp. NHM501043]
MSELKPTGNLTSASRTLSASSLKDRLSKLSVTPINPVAALHANVKYVVGIFFSSSASETLHKLCSCTDTQETQAADVGSGGMVGHDCDNYRGVSSALVRPMPVIYPKELTISTVLSSIPPVWPFLAIYLVWARCLDDSPEHGGRMIGKPIHVEKSEKPDIEEVVRVQQLYIEELTRIWNTYKDEFAKARLQELNIID